jgi:hypothetical protein
VENKSDKKEIVEIAEENNDEQKDEPPPEPIVATSVMHSEIAMTFACPTCNQYKSNVTETFRDFSVDFPPDRKAWEVRVTISCSERRNDILLSYILVSITFSRYYSYDLVRISLSRPEL